MSLYTNHVQPFGVDNRRTAMKNNANGWSVAAILFALSALCQTWSLGYSYAERECQEILENNDE